MNKVLIRVYIPAIERSFDVWIPLNKRLCNVIKLIIKAVNEFTRGEYNPHKMPMVYDKETAKEYDLNLIVLDSTIRNGTELILI